MDTQQLCCVRAAGLGPAAARVAVPASKLREGVRVAAAEDGHRAHKLNVPAGVALLHPMMHVVIRLSSTFDDVCACVVRGHQFTRGTWSMQLSELSRRTPKYHNGKL